MRPIAEEGIVYGLSVPVTSASSAKTAEPIEMSFEGILASAPRTMCYMDVHIGAAATTDNSLY